MSHDSWRLNSTVLVLFVIHVFSISDFILVFCFNLVMVLPACFTLTCMLAYPWGRKVGFSKTIFVILLTRPWILLRNYEKYQITALFYSFYFPGGHMSLRLIIFCVHWPPTLKSHRGVTTRLPHIYLYLCDLGGNVITRFKGAAQRRIDS